MIAGSASSMLPKVYGNLFGHVAEFARIQNGRCF